MHKRALMQYGESYSLRVRIEEQTGTVVEMRIPLQDEGEGERSYAYRSSGRRRERDYRRA
jgi:hypothetical protein